MDRKTVIAHILLAITAAVVVDLLRHLLFG